MPKRSRSGVVSRPWRVVAPIRVNARQVDPHRPRRRPLADDQVERAVLHRRVEHFLDHRIEPVDLVDEQHVGVLEVGQQRGEVAGLGDHRAGGGAEADPHLARDDLRQRRLAEPGRAEEQHMVDRLAARSCAASMNTRRFSRAACCPTNSSSVLGRSAASASSGWRWGVVICAGSVAMRRPAEGRNGRHRTHHGEKAERRTGVSVPRPTGVVEGILTRTWSGGRRLVSKA